LRYASGQGQLFVDDTGLTSTMVFHWSDLVWQSLKTNKELNAIKYGKAPDAS
jgi:hypothetical protein